MLKFKNRLFRGSGSACLEPDVAALVDGGLEVKFCGVGVQRSQHLQI